MSWESFQTAFQNAPADRQEVAGGEIIPTCISKAVHDGIVDGTQAKQVTQLFATQYLDPSQKDTVIAELKTAGVPNGEALLQTLSVCVGNGTGKTEASLENDIKEAEAVLQKVPKFRTMPEDIKSQAPEEPTYTTTQEAILKESRENSN